MRGIPQRGALAIVAAAALTLAACSSSNSGGGTTGTPNSGANPAPDNTPVTLTWWNNGTTDPVKSTWAQVVKDYQTAHPNVTIKNEPFQNEQFQTKVPLALQGSDPPDLYQQWGGGNMASQLTSGKVMDLTQAASGWIAQVGTAAAGWQAQGKQYGIPYDRHVVGFWYRTDLFARAGITTPPATIDEFRDAIAKLKQANIIPVAVGSKDRWPDAFYWAYFAIRACSTETLRAASDSLKLDDPCWVKAGNDLKAFLDLQPFQSAFLGTPAQQGAGSSAGLVATGKAAMELQGDWELATMMGLTSDKTLPSKLGWFPFPAVPGGAGDPKAVLGGGDGFSCTTTAPAAACVDFLKYITSADVQKKLVAAGFGLPVNPEATSALTDNTLKTVLQASQDAPYTQTYFDIAFPTTVGQALNDSIANYFAGKGSPESIVQDTIKAADDK